MDELEWKILSLTARRGVIGATREDLFREIRGSRYEDLEAAVRRLEAGGYLQVEWSGPNRFILTVTPKGSEVAATEYEEQLRTYRERIETQRKASDGVERI